MKHETLAQAIVAAQSEIGGAKKDKTGQIGQQRYRYADLTAAWEACESALSEHGLAVLQLPGPYTETEGGGLISLTTILLHESGQELRDTMQMPTAQRNPQAVGSALTYARRYALSAMLGITSEDDDGQSAMPQRQQQQWQGRPAQKAPETQQEDRQREPLANALQQLNRQECQALSDKTKEYGVAISDLGLVFSEEVTRESYPKQVWGWLHKADTTLVDGKVVGRDFDSLCQLAREMKAEVGG